VEVGVQVCSLDRLFDVPDTDGEIIAARREDVSVGVERDGSNRFLVSFEGRLQLSGLRVPDVNFVPGRGRDPLAVFRPRDGADRVFRPPVRPNLAAVAEVPDLDRGIAGPGGEP